MICCDVIFYLVLCQMKMKLSIFLPVFNFINQQDVAASQVYYLFKYSSTCFGHPHAHHQELQQLQQQPLVYRWSLVIAVLLVVVGPAGSRPTALLSPSSDGKPVAAAATVVVAPDDGHEGAQNMLSLFKQQVINLRSCCILFFDSVDSMMMHELANPNFSVCLHSRTLHTRNPLKPSRT